MCALIFFFLINKKSIQGAFFLRLNCLMEIKKKNFNRDN